MLLNVCLCEAIIIIFIIYWQRIFLQRNIEKGSISELIIIMVMILMIKMYDKDKDKVIIHTLITVSIIYVSYRYSTLAVLTQDKHALTHTHR